VLDAVTSVDEFQISDTMGRRHQYRLQNINYCIFKKKLSVAYDPEGWQNLDRLQNITKLAGKTCHLILIA